MQIIVYTGAILMLFLFVLMLVGVDASDSMVETIRGQRVLAVVAGLVLGVLLATGLGQISLGTVVGLDEANAGRQRPGSSPTSCSPRYVFAFEVDQRAADHRRDRARWCSPTGSGSRRRRRSAAWPPTGCGDYAEKGTHLGPLPAPGVFARHNAVDTPALLPDGTASSLSVSRVLAARGTVRSAPALADDIEEVQRSLAGAARRAGAAADTSAGSGHSTEQGPGMPASQAGEAGLDDRRRDGPDPANRRPGRRGRRR